MDRATYGTALALLGVLVLAGTLTVGAVTAPDRTVAADGGDGDRPRTLVGSQGGGTGWHDHGSVYLLLGDRKVWEESGADSYFDVTMLEDGRVMAGFMHSGYEEGCEPYDAPCTKTGFRIIDPATDGGPAVVDEYAFPVRSGENSEVHDVELLDTGEYLVTDMDEERLFTVRDGEVTWEWRADSFYEAPDDPTRRDWLHINDVDAVNETHYLVSVRNANQVLLVERDEGVVEVINEDADADDASCRRPGQLVDADGDGDVRCGDPSILNHQHNPQWLDDGAVLIADSDNDRVVELHRNATTGEWEPAWTLTEAGGLELHWPRDADRLDNGNTLVTDTRNRRVLEVAPNGTVVWSTETRYYPYEAERLPEGERVGAERYDGSVEGTLRGDGGEAGGGLSPLSTGIAVVQAVYPGVPFWFREAELGLTLLALGLAVAGVVVRRRA